MSVADNLASLGLDEEPAQPARRAKTKPASAQEAPKKPKCASAAKPASAGAAEQASAEEGAKRKKKSGAAANGKRTASAAGAAEPSAQEEGTQQKRRAGAAGAPASKRRERDGEGGAGEDHAAEIEAEIEACDAEIEACDAEIATRKAAAATQKAEEAKAKAAEERAQQEAKLQKAQQEAEAKLAQQLAETAKQTAATQKAEEAKAKAAEEKAQEAEAKLQKAQQEGEAKLAQQLAEKAKAQQEGEAKLAQQLAEKAKHTVAARQAEADAKKTEQDAETKKAEANAKKAEQDAETNKAEAEKAEENGKKAKENANIAATDETVESEQAEEAAKKAEEAKPAGESKWGNRRAAWASYIRTLEPAIKRGCKTDKCPEGIALQIIAGGEKMRTQYFNLFYKYEEWGRVVASEEHMKIASICTRTMDCWLTAGQIMDLYKDEAVTNEIVKEKSASRHTWRPHPEIPAIKAAIQYLCAVKDEKVNKAQHIVKSAFKWEGELQGAEAKMAMQDVAARSDKMINDGAAGMRAIEDYPAGQVPGTPRTPGTPGGNKGGKGGKTEEDKAAEKAARETANAVAREQAREKRRQDKLLPGPRAQAWCQKVQTYIDGSSEMIGSCAGSTCLPASFAAQYSTTFTAWVNTLEETRKKLSDLVAQHHTRAGRSGSGRVTR
jgi:hypothetical protein